MVVTNVPGPQLPLYTLGARMLEVFPHVPLVDNLGLGVALMSYDGKLCWGFNADYDLVPDLDRFVTHILESFVEFQEIAALMQTENSEHENVFEADVGADPGHASWKAVVAEARRNRV